MRSIYDSPYPVSLADAGHFLPGEEDTRVRDDAIDDGDYFPVWLVPLTFCRCWECACKGTDVGLESFEDISVRGRELDGEL